MEKYSIAIYRLNSWGSLLQNSTRSRKAPRDLVVGAKDSKSLNIETNMFQVKWH